MGHERFIKSTIAHSLEWIETEEMPIDRIAAIGLAGRNNEIGDAMLRVDALDAPALRKVVLLVVRRLNHRYKLENGYARRMAIAVLHEYMRPNCIYCGGKGDTHRKGAVTTVCSYCNGSGLHRYSDGDRAALIGGRFKQNAYEDALAYVRDAVRAIVTNADKRLDD